MSGKQTKAQTLGDCKVTECDGAGAEIQTVDDGDLPPDDGNTCTSEECSGGVQSHPARSSGVMCAQNGGQVCDGNGSCVECVQDADCKSTLCNVATSTCVVTCGDGIKSGSETDVDCGGGACPPCMTGQACKGAMDCIGHTCDTGKCSPSCEDTVKNTDETDVDCGGQNCPTCATGKTCKVNADCASMICASTICG